MKTVVKQLRTALDKYEDEKALEAIVDVFDELENQALVREGNDNLAEEAFTELHNLFDELELVEKVRAILTTYRDAKLEEAK